MATIQGITKQGAVKNTGDELLNFLKVFSGEVLTAFTRESRAVNNHLIKTIDSGKSASFPVMGRTVAKYLKPGNSLDDQRTAMEHNERVINIDGLLTADVLISDLFEAMNHYDVRSEYANQLGEALALSSDGAILAELAKLTQETNENFTGAGRPIKIAKTVKEVGINEEYGGAIVNALLELKAQFTNNYVPLADRIAYMKPEAVSAIIANKTAIDRDYGAVATIVDGELAKLCGFTIVQVPHLTVGGADKTGMVGASPAGHDFPTALKNDVAFLACHRTALGTVKLKDLTLEHARRPEYQADQIIAKYAMGHGGLRPEASAICTIKVGA